MSRCVFVGLGARTEGRSPAAGPHHRILVKTSPACVLSCSGDSRSYYEVLEELSVSPFAPWLS